MLRKPEVVLRKYANRRLYCMRLSRYVTLKEIRPRLLAGERVQMNATGADITALMLAELILEDARAGKLVPAQLLIFLNDHEHARECEKAAGPVAGLV